MNDAPSTQPDPESAGQPLPETAPEEASPEQPEPPAFEDLGLPAALLETLVGLGYESPTPIQARCIPPLLTGRDVLGQAQTGTGKTAAFALPVLATLDLEQRRPQALVLTPTRELAIQVAEAFRSYAANMPGFHVLAIYGGQAHALQLRPLERGVHVVVGTPGRLLDHLRAGRLDLSSLRQVVIDEADEMLRMGFLEDVHAILEATPAERTTALFSATLPREVQRIAHDCMREPEEVRLQTGTRAAATIRQRYRIVPAAGKLEFLTRFLEVEPFEAVLVFVRTRGEAADLAGRLEARGHSTAALSGEVPQKLRERVVERLRDGRLDVVVATDVAARGLDVERITHVVNYDLPPDSETYTHRIGRTGRAGREGQAILLLTPRERGMLKSVERALGTSLELLELPSADQVLEARAARFEARLLEVLDGEDLAEPTARMQAFLHRTERSAEAVLGALAFLAQGERPLRPEEVPAPAERRRPEYGTERPQREAGAQYEGSRPRRSGPPEEGMGRYYVAVGHAHGLRPGNLVGAITGESELTSEHIGRIEIHDRFSTVDLDREQAERALGALSRVVVRGQELRIRPWRDDGGEGGARPRGGSRGFSRRRGGMGRRGGGGYRGDSREEGGPRPGQGYREGGGERRYGRRDEGGSGYGGRSGGYGDRSEGDRGYGGRPDRGRSPGSGGGRRHDSRDEGDRGRRHGYQGRPEPFPRPRHRERYFGDDEG